MNNTKELECYSRAILECQLAVIRYGPNKEPNPTLYKLIDKFIQLGGTTAYAEEMCKRGLDET